MQQFFSKILKKKKVITVLLLFVVALGIIMPQIASAALGVVGGAAAGGAIGCAAGVGLAIAGIFLTGGALTVASIPVLATACAGLIVSGAYAGAGVSAVSGGLSGLDLAIIKGVIMFLYNVANDVANFSIGLFNSFISSSFFTQSILTNQGFSTGWAMTRDLADMFIVLGFVIVGIATALRIGEYGAKKLLAPLIIIALLINFSGLFCGLIIDGTNIVQKQFLSGGGGQMGTYIIHDIEIKSDGTDWNAASKAGVINLVLVCVPFIIGFLLVAIVYFYLALILVARWAIFGILFVLSPLAFLCWVFPATKKLWNMWWETFIKWGFIGAQVAFFVWAASLMLQTNAAVGSAQNSQDANAIYHVPTIEMLAVLILLYVAVTMARKASGAVGSSVIGLAKGAAGFAMGAGVGMVAAGAKMADKGVLGGRGSAAAQKLSTGYGKTLERLGLRQRGSTVSANSKQVEEKASLMSKEYAAAKASGDTGTIERIQKQARTAKGAEGAAAMKVVTDAKDLHDTFAERDAKGKVIRHAVTGKTTMAKDLAAERTKYAEASGATGIREKVEKLDPRLRAYNKPAVEKLMKPIPQGGKGLSPADAEKEAMAEGFTKFESNDILNASKEVLSSEEFEENVGHGALARALPRMTDEKIDEVKKILPSLKGKTLTELGLPAGATKVQVKTAVATLKASVVPADQEKGKRLDKWASKYLLLEKY